MMTGNGHWVATRDERSVALFLAENAMSEAIEREVLERLKDFVRSLLRSLLRRA